MYENNTEDAIKQRMLDEVPSTLDKTEGSFVNDALSPVAVELAQSYVDLENFLKLVFAKTSSGDYLTNRASEFGVDRKTGTKTTGVVKFSGTNGVVIPTGTPVQTANGIVFNTLSVGTISGGFVNINVEAEDVGTIYNIPTGAITQLQAGIVGVTSVTNESTFTSGTGEETDADLLARLLAKVQAPPSSGNATDYRNWALSVAGVGDCKVLPLWAGNGSVKLVLVDANKQPVTSTIRDNVAIYVDSVRPIGANVTTVSATSKTINITVTVTLASGYTTAQVQSNIISKVTDYLKSIALNQSYVSIAKIGSIILDGTGALDYSNLQLNGTTSNVAIASTETPILGTVVVS